MTVPCQHFQVISNIRSERTKVHNLSAFELDPLRFRLPTSWVILHIFSPLTFIRCHIRISNFSASSTPRTRTTSSAAREPKAHFIYSSSKRKLEQGHTCLGTWICLNLHPSYTLRPFWELNFRTMYIYIHTHTHTHTHSHTHTHTHTYIYFLSLAAESFV
jgi:hypothetical protein